MSEKIKVIACSGIGKVFGLMAREAALEAAEREPELAENVCLAHLVTGKEAAEKKVKGCSCITHRRLSGALFRKKCGGSRRSCKSEIPVCGYYEKASGKGCRNRLSTNRRWLADHWRAGGNGYG